MQEKGKSVFLSALKIAIISLIASCVLILLFALILNIAFLSSNTIKIVNQFIKAICLIVASLIVIKESDGALKGGIGGVLYTLFIHLFFLLFSENQFGSLFWLDMAFCMIIGVIAGIIAINIKK